MPIIPQDTPDVRAQVEPLVAPYGDKVRLRFGVPRPEPAKTLEGSYVPPLAAPAPAKPAPRLRDHVSLPATARCVRGGTLTIKPGQDVRRLCLAAGSRKVVAGNGKAAKLKLKARRTKVAVTVTLEDGRTAAQTFTYRRC